MINFSYFNFVSSLLWLWAHKYSDLIYQPGLTWIKCADLRCILCLWLDNNLKNTTTPTLFFLKSGPEQQQQWLTFVGIVRMPSTGLAYLCCLLFSGSRVLRILSIYVNNRYKMPRLVAKVEGKGNGIKTVIPNMGDIARALGRPPTCKWSKRMSFPD